jgi:hypothetical protein
VRIAAVLCTFLFAAILRAQDTPASVDKQIAPRARSYRVRTRAVSSALARPTIETEVTPVTAVARVVLFAIYWFGLFNAIAAAFKLRAVAR